MKIAERNDELLRFHASFDEREKRVWELETPGLKFFYWQGVSYRAYRMLRGKASQLKQRLKNRRNT